MRKIRVGLFGSQGHQVHGLLAGNPHAELAAIASFDAPLPAGCGEVAVYESLDRLLDDASLDLISFCSPVRADQAKQCIRAMEAGKHVYAEKPCAMTEEDLDALIRTAQATGRQFHEMAGTSVEPPYAAMRASVLNGAVGTVVQVLAQKCYPWTDRRPSDEAVDGGLALQVGVYLTRFVEHVACVRIRRADMVETTLGNPGPASSCRRAVSMTMTLENGGLASGVANYLNPMSGKVWGYDMLRIFGTDGLIETCAETGVTRLIRKGREPEILDTHSGEPDYFNRYVLALLGKAAMPLTMEAELSPTRWAIRARAAARCANGCS